MSKDSDNSLISVHYAMMVGNEGAAIKEIATVHGESFLENYKEFLKARYIQGSEVAAAMKREAQKFALLAGGVNA